LKTRPSSVLAHRSLQRSLDRASSRVPEAAHKLWFIQRTLSAFEASPSSLRRIPALRALLLRYLALEAMGELAFGPRQGRVTISRPLLFCFYRLRHLGFALTALTLAAGVGGAGIYAYGLARAGTDWIFEQVAPPPEAPRALPSGTAASVPMGGRSGQVWLVERSADEELWSNGLRIVTSFETPGDPRRYFAFPRNGSPPVPMSAPVGIIFHASESDMAPFAPAFSGEILKTTKDLIGWLSRRRIYHYVIDRFGQVYRIVPDDAVAVHAGVSIWGDDRYYYLNLNESFIGVAFESQVRHGRDESLTTAQIQSASNLTEVLRGRHHIAEINCVPHGLVSVNAGKKLIGYHSDLARDFPFAALGIADNYQIPPASIAGFGFGYDEDLVARLGGSLWPGVALAESALERQAAAEGMSLDGLRSRLQQRYFENVELAKLSRSDAGPSSGRATERARPALTSPGQ
jgi:hypothetical protein